MAEPAHAGLRRSRNTATSSGNVTNTSSPTATATTAAFMQVFSADLQAMLTQAGSSSAATPASATPSTASTASAQSPSDPISASDQTSNAAQHHPHHHHGGEAGSTQDAANQLVAEIGQSVQGGTLTTSQINQSAGLFASDVMQALQSYGTAAPMFLDSR